MEIILNLVIVIGIQSQFSDYDLDLVDSVDSVDLAG